MKLFTTGRAPLAIGLLSTLMSAHADERRFGYTYEPETLPAGALEFENWVTLRAGRSTAVGQENFNRWDLRQEVEYGVSDRYTVAFYLNEKAQGYRDPGTGADISGFTWEGVSLENRFNILNPAEHAVGLTFYLEGRYSGEEAALEQKIILGQRHGAWKWALNIEHETEWEHQLHDVEAEVGASFGVARDIGQHWSLGLELRSQSLLPDYDAWENSALYVGPTLGFRQEKWWAVLSVQPQVYGWNDRRASDGNAHLELNDHERFNIRFLTGFSF